MHIERLAEQENFLLPDGETGASSDIINWWYVENGLAYDDGRSGDTPLMERLADVQLQSGYLDPEWQSHFRRVA